MQSGYEQLLPRFLLSTLAICFVSVYRVIPFVFFQSRFTYISYVSPNNETVCCSSYIRYKAQQREYENHIADLETDQVKSKLKINELQKELKKYKDLVNKQPCHLAEMEDTLTPYKEQLVELSTLLENEKGMLLEKEKNEKELMDKLANMEAQYEELQHNLNVKRLAMVYIYRLLHKINLEMC